MDPELVEQVQLLVGKDQKNLIKNLINKSDRKSDKIFESWETSENIYSV